VITDVKFQARLHDVKARVSRADVLSLLIAQYVDNAAASNLRNADLITPE